MLKRKMFRDIKQNASQFITIFLMIMIGVMVYSGIKSYMDGMKDTADVFYKENNLQDLNVLGLMNKDDLKIIKSLDNVNDAELKLSITATTDNDKTLLLNFIETNNISKLYVFEGEEFSSKDGIWLDKFYAEKNNIKVGDEVLVKYETMKLKEKVLGLINVPDHLYDVRDESELYPDRTEFGFAYMSIDAIDKSYIKSLVMKEMKVTDEKTFDMTMPNFNYKDYIPYNTIMVDVNKKSNKNKVKDEIEEKLDNAKAVIKIEDTLSYVTYQGEIDEGKTYIGVFSGVFLFIAMLSVITTMTRIVKKEWK